MTGKHGALMLIVSGLSDKVTRRDLRSHFRQFLKSKGHNRWLGQGMIRSCEIVRITDLDNGDLHYHGLVELQPAKLALLAIRELTGTLIDGHPLEVRRYHHRTAFYDQGGGTPAEGPEGRRPNQTVELVERRKAPSLPSLVSWVMAESKTR